MTLAIGLVAAALSIASFVAQVRKLVKTRDTHALATGMWVLSTTAFALWTLYGFLLGAWPVVVPNAICFVLAAFILTFKLLPRRARHTVADKLTSQAPG
jgi:MtN3 and saliva related transmembrane protein